MIGCSLRGCAQLPQQGCVLQAALGPWKKAAELSRSVVLARDQQHSLRSLRRLCHLWCK